MHKIYSTKAFFPLLTLTFLAAIRPTIQAGQQQTSSPEVLEQIRLCRTLSGEARVVACKEAVRLSPYDAEIHHSLGKAYLENFRLDEAVRACREAVRLRANDWEAYYTLAKALASLGKNEEAIRLCRAVISAKPNAIWARAGLGCVLHSLGKQSEAKKLYMETVRLTPRNYDALYSLGKLLEEQGSHMAGNQVFYLQEAANAYRKCAQLKPDKAQSLWDLAWVMDTLAFTDREQTDHYLVEEEEVYREIIRLMPDSAEARQKLGGVRSVLGRHDKALESYREALRLDPSNDDYLKDIAGTLQQLGRHEEAIETYSQLAALRPDDYQRQIDLAFAFAALDRTVEAEKAYREAVRISPQKSEPRRALGHFLIAKGRLKEAIEAYREALHLANPDLQTNLISIQSTLSVYAVDGGGNRDREVVLQISDEMLRLAPEDVGTHLFAAKALQAVGHDYEALVEYRTAIGLDPKNAKVEKALSLFALLRLTQGKDEAALGAYRELAQLRPNDAQLRVKVGDSLCYLNRFAEAVLSYREAIRLAPKLVDAYYQLGITLSILERYSEAIDPLQQAIRLNPNNASAHGEMAGALFALDSFAEAIAAWDKAVQIDPGYFDTRSAERKAWEYCKQLARSTPKPTSAPGASPAPAPKKTTAPKLVSGSGFFITTDGYLLTAGHLIRGSSKISVRTGAVELPAHIVKVDAANDLAVLKVDGIFRPLPLGNAGSITLGTSVFTIGFPNVQIQGLEPKLTRGETNSLAGIQDEPRHFQTSVQVQPGNSGGALVDDRGNVVGLVVHKLDAATAFKLTGDLPQNVNYAIKVNYAKLLLETIPEITGKLLPPYARPRPFEDAVKTAQGAAALVVVQR